MPKRRKKATQRTIQRRTRLKAARLVRVMNNPPASGSTPKASSASTSRTSPRLLAPPNWTS